MTIFSNRDRHTFSCDQKENIAQVQIGSVIRIKTKT